MNSVIARQLDQHAYLDTPVHHLDARIKIIAALFFCGTVISFPKYALASLIPFALFPVIMAIIGRVPLKPIIGAIVRTIPFAIAIGIFNPFLDRTTHLVLADISISGGWISFLSIIARFVLTLSTVLVLVATTPFPELGAGLARLGLPQVFIDQLLVLYRYLFLLMEEGQMMARAAALRMHTRKVPNLRSAVEMLTTLFLRSWSRAEMIYHCMEVRGFNGPLAKTVPGRLSLTDGVFLAAIVVYCLLLRLNPPHEMMGKLCLKIFQ